MPMFDSTIILFFNLYSQHRDGEEMEMRSSCLVSGMKRGHLGWQRWVWCDRKWLTLGHSPDGHTSWHEKVSGWDGVSDDNVWSVYGVVSYEGKRMMYIQQSTREIRVTVITCLTCSCILTCTAIHLLDMKYFFFICDSWYKWMLYQCPCLITWLTNSPSFDYSSVPPMDSKHHSLLFIINNNFSFRRCVPVFCVVCLHGEWSGQKEKVVLMMVTL